MSRLSTLLRYLSVWLRPPKIANVDLEEVEGDTVPFVRPVFVLSTGRCGTKWLTELLRQDPQMRVNHSDYPELIRHSRLAYEQYEQEPHLFQEIIRATRDGYILDAHKREMTYIETNNRITFFAYALRAVYPQARFLHIVRHPGDFVRSGLRRGWYRGAPHDVGRIRDHHRPNRWRQMTDVEKIAWLWNETNQCVEDFSSILRPREFFRVKAEEMFNEVNQVEQIADFIGVNLTRKLIEKHLSRKVNEQILGSVAPYEEWSIENKKQVRHHALLAERYGYQV